MQVAQGMVEAEASYTRRLNAAKMQGTSIEEIEDIQNRKVRKEIAKRVQVRSDLKGYFSVADAVLATITS